MKCPNPVANKMGVELNLTSLKKKPIKDYRLGELSLERPRRKVLLRVVDKQRNNCTGSANDLHSIRMKKWSRPLSPGE